MTKRAGRLPYTVDRAVHRRFDERKTIFGRIHWDREASFYHTDYRDSAPEKIAEGAVGYSRVDFARALASWTVHDRFRGAFSWERLGQADPSMLRLERHEVDDPARMSEQVKETARLFGADLVGISRIDRAWIYSHDRSGDPVEVPESCTHAVVMAIAMDKAATAASPAYPCEAATGVGYSKMAFTLACVADFIRNLRYRAIPMGNDTALSVPLAIDAGLGQMGRNGILTTPEYGSCVRLCKVLTDLPLVADRPIDFGLTETCMTCTRCADACDAGAISRDPEPSFEIACPSNNPGILRWAVDADRCYAFWSENTAACSNCIAACPFSKIGWKIPRT
jgi:epoxyqueuosine reductase